MQTRRFYSLGLAITLCLVAIAALFFVVGDPVVALATPRYVATTGTNVGTCNDPEYPCQTVQYAVDQSDHSDTIKVAGGIYKGALARPAPDGYGGAPASGVVTQVVYLTKTVQIEGGYTAPLYAWPPDPEANPTILDAEGQGRVVLISSYGSPNLIGLSITGGDATGLGGDYSLHDTGGGIYITRATVNITNTRVLSNSAQTGGGVFVYSNADVRIEDCDILTNTATGGPGGVHAQDSRLKLIRNTIMANTGFTGGGVGLGYSTGELRDNIISSNIATLEGGGVRLFGGHAVLDGNLITGNSAGSGGGLALKYYNRTDLYNNVVAYNQASNLGSGLLIERSYASLYHTTIADNSQGDGIGLAVTNLLTHNSSVALTNTILVSHPVGLWVNAGNTTTLEATLWHGNGANTVGAGAITLIAPNVDMAPGFLNPDNGDYHLARGSAAIDAGVPAGVSQDIDRQPRPMNAGYDLGADEALWTAYLPLVMRRLP